MSSRSTPAALVSTGSLLTFFKWNTSFVLIGFFPWELNIWLLQFCAEKWEQKWEFNCYVYLLSIRPHDFNPLLSFTLICTLPCQIRSFFEVLLGLWVAPLAARSKQGSYLSYFMSCQSSICFPLYRMCGNFLSTHRLASHFVFIIYGFMTLKFYMVLS